MNVFIDHRSASGLLGANARPMRRRGWSCVLGLSFSCAVACGGTGDSTFTNTERPDGGSSSDSGPVFATNDGSTAVDDCVAEAKLVYVVSQEKDLYSFDPSTVTFTKIGRMDCPTAGVPVSMVIDRSSTAWVNYADGSLFRVSTRDASCTATEFAPGQQGFLKFGMAFATEGSGSTKETLYVSGLLGSSGKGFGKIDLATMKLTMIGEYSNALAGTAAELTGTGDGRLYGFFTTAPHATLARIDMASGATSGDTSLAGVSTGNAFAFSFWGGDFWFYTSDGASPSRVTRLQTSGSGELVVAKEDVGGFRIVGAGVSTCAPTTPPR